VRVAVSYCWTVSSEIPLLTWVNVPTKRTLRLDRPGSVTAQTLQDKNWTLGLQSRLITGLYSLPGPDRGFNSLSRLARGDRLVRATL